MEAAFVRNAQTGQFVSKIPLQFVRIPCIGESVQLGNVVWVVSSVIHAWRSPNEPIIEIRVTPPNRNENLPVENSMHE